MDKSLVLMISIMALFAGAFGAQAQQDSPFEPTACWFGNPSRFTIDCGYLTVPEDHTQPDGAQIRLAISIIRSEAAQVQPDPVVFLAGGPGGGITHRAPLLAFTLGAAVGDRDVILLDQRGMGASQPSLGCPEITPPYVLDLMANTHDDYAPYQACRARLVEQGVDFAAYTTPQNAADVAALRTALGYEQINLVGVSYGTRLAQAVMDLHPDGIRSVVLDSSVPLEAQPSDLAGFAAQFDQLVAVCQADPVCGVSYGNLRQVYEDAYDHLNAQPVTLESEGVTFQLTGDLLAMLVFQHLYRPDTLAAAPGFIYNVAAGDYRVVVEAISSTARSGLSETSVGSQLSIACSENLIDTSPQQLAALADVPAPYRRALPFTGQSGVEMCQLWNVPSIPSYGEFRSNIPTLIMAGELDPVTPPSTVEAIVPHLSRAFSITFAGMGHGLSMEACSSVSVSRFINDPTQAPTTDCTTELPPFVVDAAATRPIVQGLAVALSLAAVGGFALVILPNFRAGYGGAWRAAARTVGWIALTASTAGILLSALSDAGRVMLADHLTMVQAVITLVVGIQAGLLFSPDDEPALEVQLACPRPIQRTVLERLAILLGTQTMVATAGTLLSLSLVADQNVAEAFARWIAPMLLLTGIGLFITTRTRIAAFGMTLAGLLWFAFNIAGDLFLPGQAFPVPLNYIQPFLWSIHAFLAPDALLTGDFWLNRVVVGALGVVLILLALNELRDEESVLLHSSKRQRVARNPGS